VQENRVWGNALSFDVFLELFKAEFEWDVDTALVLFFEEDREP
jgi:hypothetical protein